MNRGRWHLEISGHVQGIGYRPFVYRLAKSLNLSGWIKNTSNGVSIEIEGASDQVQGFRDRLQNEKPEAASVTSIKFTPIISIGEAQFSILESERSLESSKTAEILPDLATCSQCIRELFDTNNRRYLYPFINCTQCGPRYSIVEGLPYDRHNTTMKEFILCQDCFREFNDVNDRRFHAQPNCCSRCGPRLELWDNTGRVITLEIDALDQAVEAIKKGKTVAVKGLGGFHLMVDARRDQAVLRLREKKARPEKPFALMVPSLESAKALCQISEPEAGLLTSRQAPIVLLLKLLIDLPLAASVAPKNPYLGIMLPYTPLHHLLMNRLGFPIVATSGNISEEPICFNEQEVVSRLGKTADFFLVHNRPIVSPLDDSIARIFQGQEVLLRRARGYSPMMLELEESVPTILGVGAHLKNTVAISLGNRIWISPHIGNLSTRSAALVFEDTIQRFERIYGKKIQAVSCDLHPDYYSTQKGIERGEQSNLPVIKIQHHHAHVLACMAEHRLKGPVLGLAWDGSGYGSDGTVWGGEFLFINEESCQRVGHFRTFYLPGGEGAVKEPRRAALGMMFEIFAEDLFNLKTLSLIKLFSEREILLLGTMLKKDINTVKTSSVGRIFDAVAAVLDLRVGFRDKVTFEGQAAMALEFETLGTEVEEPYPFILRTDENVKKWVVDWEPMMIHLLQDSRSGMKRSRIASKFHSTLAAIAAEVALKFEIKQVVLTGGCFQNQILLERTINRLKKEGRTPYFHRRFPSNDSSIALGQVFGACQRRA